VNERRNPTLCVDNRFFSSSFHGFSKGDDSVAQRLSGQIGKTSPLRSKRPKQGFCVQSPDFNTCASRLRSKPINERNGFHEKAVGVKSILLWLG